MKVNVELEQDDLYQIMETVHNATEIELTTEQAQEIWDKHLPDHIKDLAIHWGMSDTPVRDDIYVWAEENIVAIKFMNIQK